ncbi:unnamed protein product [Arabis nemorensis]|uniref:Uncharacterized protein n=1 Tax=Arabis nemorensis TaxID=586526 RepID=A0A565CC96_9BRAS|nr:unnamed protein product [Arabis nemorensis]
METPVVKGCCLGFCTLPDIGQEVISSTTFSSSSELEEQLKTTTENIATLKRDKAVKDKSIKYLEELARKVVDKCQEFHSPPDEDETQE